MAGLLGRQCSLSYSTNDKCSDFFFKETKEERNHRKARAQRDATCDICLLSGRIAKAPAQWKKNSKRIHNTIPTHTYTLGIGQWTSVGPGDPKAWGWACDALLQGSTNKPKYERYTFSFLLFQDRVFLFAININIIIVILFHSSPAKLRHFSFLRP